MSARSGRAGGIIRRVARVREDRAARPRLGKANEAERELDPAERESAAAMLADVEALCAFEGRRPGSDAERRAANHLASRLRELGCAAGIEATYVHPQWPLVVAAHCLLGFAASLIAVPLPAVGFAAALLLAASLYFDLNTRLYLLRTLFFRRGSQNVVSRGARPDAPARLLLVAHYDAGRTGSLYGPGGFGRAAAFVRRLGLNPERLPFWSLALLVPILGARLAGFDSPVTGAVQLLPTLTLLAAAFALADIQLSPTSPGANDNASGVAVALALAAELRRRPPRNLDVWLVLTGGGETLGEGMRAFLRRHRRELDRETTFLLVLDSLGRGELRYVASEGPAVPYAADGRLLELASTLGAPAEGADGPRAEPLHTATVSDALPAHLRGLPALALTTREQGASAPANHHLPTDTPEGLDARALVRARDFALSLIGALDRDLDRLQTGEEGADA